MPRAPNGRFHRKHGCTIKSPFEPEHGFQRRLAPNLDAVPRKGARLGDQCGVWAGGHSHREGARRRGWCVHARRSLTRTPPRDNVSALWLYLSEQLSRKVPVLGAAVVEQLFCRIAVQDPDGDFKFAGVCNRNNTH